ncbi:MAG TPA: isoprenylcysteine carboxylmethyltransferase family protein [Stenotrophomonas sp.]|jgi:protein-S-isoprenylcysteine O-methyltransferase Ste14
MLASTALDPRTALALVHALAWLAFAGYWLWSARHLKSTRRSERPWTQLLAYWLPLLVAVWLLGPGAWFEASGSGARFIPGSIWISATGVALTWAGVALALWSRRILGSNWSSVVQVKQDHELIQQGPYRRIRHPIYTGLLLAFAGTALMIGEWRGVLALVIVFASFWRKLRLEERWLGEQFGKQYADYRRRTKALIPGLF